jgi:anti-anti-sigma factor
VELRCRYDGDLVVFELSGRITSIDGAEPLRQRFREAVNEGHRNFLFDLRELLFMDSPSIGEMCACFKRASDVSGTVELLVKPHGTIDQVIRLSGLQHVFHVHYDEAALERADTPRGADPESPFHK